MEPQPFSSNLLQQVVEKIFSTHRINRLDQELLMTALLSQDQIAPPEKAIIDRIFAELQRGTLRVA